MHSIWAVARNTLAQTLRMKIAAVVVLLLLILLPLMSVVMDGDGTLLGKLQTFTSYGLGLISLLLCVLTVAVSTFTLSNEVKRKHIFLVITKPIRRWEFILGKLIAVILLNVFLLSVFSVVLYTCTLLIPKMIDAPEDQIIRAQAEFFTSRMGLKVALDEDMLKLRAEKRYEELEKASQLPAQMSYSRIMIELLGQERMKERKVDPGEAKAWEFNNVHLENTNEQEAVFFVRCQYKVTITPPDEQVFGVWRIGDLRQLKDGAKIKTTIYSARTTSPIRVAQEFSVPADAIAEDGYLAIEFFNDPSLNQTTIIPEDLEVLYRTGGFTGNFFRAVLLILVRLIFLSVLGISLTTWLSFPVAILVCVTVLCIGLVNGFILDAIGNLGVTAGVVYSLTVKPMLWLLPQFDGVYSPNGYIVDGRTIQWAFLVVTASVTLLIKGLLMLLVGILIFSYREVAKVVA